MNKQETDRLSLMFEQLNEQLGSIHKQIEEIKPLFHQKETAPTIKQVEALIEKSQTQNDKYATTVIDGMTLLNNNQIRTAEKIKTFYQDFLSYSSKKDMPMSKKHLQINIKSFRFLLISLFLIISFLLSIIANIDKSKQIHHMEDNNLKYQIIKNNNGIDNSGLIELERLFSPQRDSEAIKQLQENLCK